MNRNAQSATTAKTDLPPVAVKKATNLVRDARLAVLVGLIPLLGLVYMLRLVQWYQLRSQYPALNSSDLNEHAVLASEFRDALPRLWLAVLLWPALILFIMAYGILS